MSEREYPLYGGRAVDLCPTARYVGGISVFLCECPEPGKCPGVRESGAARVEERRQRARDEGGGSR